MYILNLKVETKVDGNEVQTVEKKIMESNEFFDIVVKINSFKEIDLSAAIIWKEGLDEHGELELERLDDVGPLSVYTTYKIEDTNWDPYI